MDDMPLSTANGRNMDYLAILSVCKVAIVERQGRLVLLDFIVTKYAKWGHQCSNDCETDTGSGQGCTFDSCRATVLMPLPNNQVSTQQKTYGFRASASTH
jgi:hypothetical protein